MPSDLLIRTTVERANAVRNALEHTWTGCEEGRLVMAFLADIEDGLILQTGEPQEPRRKSLAEQFERGPR